MLCKQEHVTNIFPHTLMSRYISPLFKIFQLFFMIPNVHSTSFLTLTKFEEKYLSAEAAVVLEYGQIVCGQRRYITEPEKVGIKLE
jgi:hypothetical protein